MSKATQQARAGRQAADMGRRTCAWEPESPGPNLTPTPPARGPRAGASSAPHLCRCTSGSSRIPGGSQIPCAVEGVLRCRGSGQGSQSRCGGAPGASTPQPKSPAWVRRSSSAQPHQLLQGCCAQNSIHLPATVSIPAVPCRSLSSACPAPHPRVCRPQDRPLTWLAKSRWHTVWSSGSFMMARITCSIGVMPTKQATPTRCVSACCIYTAPGRCLGSCQDNRDLRQLPGTHNLGGVPYPAPDSTPPPSRDLGRDPGPHTRSSCDHAHRFHRLDDRVRLLVWTDGKLSWGEQMG